MKPIIKRVLKISAAISALAITSGLGAWWWQATRAEKLVNIKLPAAFTALAGRLYGVNNEQRVRIISPDAAVGVAYSIAIHKSQIKPWGTLWRREVQMRLVGGKVEWAGETNMPLGSPFRLTWKENK